MANVWSIPRNVVCGCNLQVEWIVHASVSVSCLRWKWSSHCLDGGYWRYCLHMPDGWNINNFKKNNQRWPDTVTIMADKDFIERCTLSWVSWSFHLHMLISHLKDLSQGNIQWISWVNSSLDPRLLSSKVQLGWSENSCNCYISKWHTAHLHY